MRTKTENGPKQILFFCGTKHISGGNLLTTTFFLHCFNKLVKACLCGLDSTKWRRIFSKQVGEFARADKAVPLRYHYQRSTDTNVCGGFTRSRIVGGWTQERPNKNALPLSFVHHVQNYRHCTDNVAVVPKGRFKRSSSHLRSTRSARGWVEASRPVC